MGLRLVPLGGGKAIKLDKPVLLFGRNPDCDVVLTESRKVSRTHCLVACVDNRVFVRDLASTNGVWVNGERIDREHRVRMGDELGVADVRYELVSSDDARAKNGKEVPSKDRAKQRDAEYGRRQHPSELPRREIRQVVIDPDRAQPIALPDEDDSFVVEPSLAQIPSVKASAPKPPRKNEDIVLKFGDSSGDLPLPKKSPSARATSAKQPVDSDDVLPVRADEPFDDIEIVSLEGLLLEHDESLEDSSSGERRRK